MRILFCIILISVFSGCGRFGDTFQRLRPGSTTDVTFATPRVQNARGEIVSFATLAGGIMVYALDADEPFRRGGRKLADEFATASWTIPTAQYVFFGVGYSAAGMSGTMYCGKTAPVQLDGSPKTIQLVLDDANCGVEPFAASGMASGNQPQPVYVAACTNNSGVTIGSPCTGSTFGGGTVSARISMPEYVAFNGELYVTEGNAQNIESGCFAPTGTAVTSNAILPTGGPPPGDVFVYGFNTYDAAGCAGYTNRRLYGLGRSLSNAGNSNFSIFQVNGAPFGPSMNPVVVGSNGSFLYVYLRDLL